MTVAAGSKTSLGKRAVGEMRELLTIAAYLYICFGAIILYKTAVLRGYGVGFAPWGVAAIKAFILAKFVLIAHALPIGRRFDARPLIWPTLYKSVVFTLFLLVLNVIEEILVGLFHGRPVGESVMQVGGGTLLELIAVCILMLLILIPYIGFRTLGEALGDDRLKRIFFVERTPSA